MTTFFAMAGVLAQTKSGGLNPVFMIGMIVIMFGFMYIFQIRPQRTKEKKLQESVSKLMKGDEVMLSGGIFGSVHSIESDTLLVKIAEKCIVKVHQRAVSTIMKEDAVVNTKEESK
jgi:preprotein translocase subunit YajC